MEDDVEIDVLLVTLFGLLAQLFREINTFVILVSYGFIKLCRQSKCRSKVPSQIEKLYFLVGYHDEICKDHIRMNINYFNRLCYLLENLGGLRDTRNVIINELVTIFLTVLSHHTKNRVIKYNFKRSGYTISKHFNLVLNTLLKLHNVLLVTHEPVPKDNNDYRWKYFKGCLGALDGTYIPIRIPHYDIPRYRNHKWNVSVNVLVVCDQHMNFIFVLSGWVGFSADSRILRDAITRSNELRVPNDFTMDGNSDVPRGSRGRKGAGSTTHMVWTFAEECELMHALKELVWNLDICLFLRTCWLLNFREVILNESPTSTPRYMFGSVRISGLGLNSTTYRIDALPEVWKPKSRVSRTGHSHSTLNGDRSLAMVELLDRTRN
ncbi:hypothetical protein ACS0TY_012141 [Phlomoides rotata]